MKNQRKRSTSILMKLLSQHFFNSKKFNLIQSLCLCQAQHFPRKYKKISMMLLNYKKISYIMAMISIRRAIETTKEREVEGKAKVSQRKKEKLN